jgi:hypothetical protein
VCSGGWWWLEALAVFDGTLETEPVSLCPSPDFV